MNAQQIAWLPEEVRNHIAQLEHDLARLTAENEIETQELAAALRSAFDWLEKGGVRSAHSALATALARAESAAPWVPKINITCETRAEGIIGTTDLNVLRVEAEDDGSFTAFTDHWPESATPGLRTDNPMAEPVMGGLPRYDGEKLAQRDDPRYKGTDYCGATPAKQEVRRE